MPTLENPLAKLGRANEHLQQLLNEARAFVKTDPYSVVNEERAADLDVARLSVREYPPLRLGLIFGDLLANWRSALDNLVYQLVLLNGCDPGGGSSFPIFVSEDHFENRGKNYIRGVRSDHAAIIEALQPFQERKDPTAQALAAVNKHVNIDKHRAIHPALTALIDAEDYAKSFRRESTTAEFEVEVEPVGFNQPLEDGMELSRIHWRPPVPNPKPLIEAEFSVEIAFGESGLALRALPAIHRHVQTVVGRFASDFND